ncbi:MAG: glycosyltransferase involved in cell wall biosynthesis [Desulforhopalus sp.]|jgi:glycosyltransferase involved in cell wall biosynthesis
MIQLVGVVVIGRNEGLRLQQCLQSILQQTTNIIYVDSGSTDGSSALADSLDVPVIQLDMNIPFTAARARNEGFKYITEKDCDIKYVQFIDGDCELCEKWLSISTQYLEENINCAVVAGRLKERFPGMSIYNQLCDLEWDTPVGEINFCGGIFLTRVKSFTETNGFNQTLIAGEEPELCYRLRQDGWKLHRLATMMALHDAEMTRFSQWWNRAKRSGYAYANGCFLHGFTNKEKFRLKECIRIWIWALFIPIIIVCTMLSGTKWWLLFSSLYLLQFVKNYSLSIHQTKNIKLAVLLTFSRVVDKFPQFIGQVSFLFKLLNGHASTLIEYK